MQFYFQISNLQEVDRYLKQYIIIAKSSLLPEIGQDFKIKNYPFYLSLALEKPM